MGMETTTNPLVVGSFRGLNTSLSDISISSREATALQNVNLTKESLDVRFGSDIFSTTQIIEGGVAKAITGMYQTVLGTTTYQVVTAGSKIYSMTSAGVLTDITGAVTLTDNKNNIFKFATFKDSGGVDIIVACNGVDAPIKWTGSGNAAVLGGSPPGNFKYILAHKNRLYGTDGEFIFHSQILNGESWDALYWVGKITSNQCLFLNEITGVAKFGEGLAIFKEDKISLFSGESFIDGYLQDGVVSGDGCISGFSIVEVSSRKYGNILVFVNRNGEIKGFNGTKDLINLSDPVDLDLQLFNQSRAKYVSAVNYKKYKQYYSTMTASGPTHNRIIAYDYFLDGFNETPVPEDARPNESTMLLHKGINANCLSIMDVDGIETLFSGTYDGWILKHGAATKDIVSASQIGASPGGAVRVGDVVTITTIAPHEFSVGDSVIISGVSPVGATTFNGTFTITATPTNKTFTFSQVAADDTGGAGISRREVNIESYWLSKRNSFGNAAIQKQINDFNIVTTSTSVGQMRVTIYADSTVGSKVVTITPAAPIYGDPVYGFAIYGGKQTSYTRVELETGSGEEGLAGRYFKFRFDNVNGYQFRLEEFIVGVTGHGYQAEYIV